MGRTISYSAEVDADVLIVGAGISGIGTAVHLQSECPDLSFQIIEKRQAIGGTWDLFRYPGVRSDSDMHTLGYHFKPWRAKKAIADGSAIWDYVNDTADEHQIRERIQFGKELIAADWRAEDQAWQVSVKDVATGEVNHSHVRFLLMCSGYYRYEGGYQPEFPGRDSFKGAWVHPQLWPEDLDYADKKVVIIGSGATAVTLLPSMAKTASKVTMLQRTPTYYWIQPSVSKFDLFLRKILPIQWAYDIVRWRNTSIQQFLYWMTRVKPEWVKKMLIDNVRKRVGDIIDVDKHFTPPYNPWDQRLCLVPDGDLFDALREGRAEVATDKIAAIEENGIRLESGDLLEADVIVSATGLELQILGGAEFTLDGEPVEFADKWTYKGLMCSDIPNMVQTFGYINASWTLRADLTAQWVCRLLNYMWDHRYHSATPQCDPAVSEAMPKRFWIDDFSAGYMQRVLHKFPKQGDRAPWINPQNYRKDRKLFRDMPIDDGSLRFS